MEWSNSLVKAVFGAYPFPVEYVTTDGTHIAGVSGDDRIDISGQEFSLSELQIQEADNGFWVEAEGYRLKFAISAGEALEYSLSIAAESKPVEYVSFAKLPFLRFDDSFCYARDIYTPQEWHSTMGRGLNNAKFETGPIIQAWPKPGESTVHACGFKGDVCAFVRSEYAVSPLFVEFIPSERYAQRSGGMALGLNRLYFDLRDRKFDSWTFAIHFIGDMNGDGRADECDYQLVLKQHLPQPCPIYKNAVWYKIMCAVNGYTHTTFKQALEIIRYIHHITNGAHQIAYLVGWQSRGHDTNYPRFNIINPDVGTREEFIQLIEEAKTRYNCTVSVHINVDDAYIGNPGWREDIICRDVDGSIMTWEVFLQRQAYHINHTKDVRSGYIFERLDEFLKLVPVTESIHIDAFRNTNSSWEADEFIGPDKEFYCGQLRIIEYLRERGIDVTTESLNGMKVEISHAFSGLYHMFQMWPILYQNIVYGGGSNYNPSRIATGASINEDLTYSAFGNRATVLRPVVLQNMLYRYMLTKNMVEYRNGGLNWRAKVRYDDGTTVQADDSCQYLEVRTEDDVLIADNTSRMIPLDGRLYVYQTQSGLFRRKLPRAFRGHPLQVTVLTECSEWLEYGVDGDYIQMQLPADTLLCFELA